VIIFMKNFKVWVQFPPSGNLLGQQLLIILFYSSMRKIMCFFGLTV